MNCVRIKLWSCISWTWLGRRWRKVFLVVRLSLHLYILLAYYKSRQARRQRWYLYLKLIFNSSSFLHTMIKQLVNPSTPRVEIRIIKTSSDPRLNNEIVQSERLAQKPRFESKSKFTFAYLLRAFSFPMIISIDHNVIFWICATTRKTLWAKHHEIWSCKEKKVYHTLFLAQ